MTGPYDVRACRGHWHVTVGGEDIITAAGDHLAEDVARAEAVRLNQAYAVSVEAMRASRDAWRDYAEHLVGCVTCGETGPDDCVDGGQFRDAAYAASAATEQSP